MLRTKAKWKFLGDSWPAQLDKMSMSPALTPITLELLNQRGITDPDEINAFLSPDIANLIEAKHLHMIDRAAHRVHEAIENDEQILVFGDYDADGVTSTTLMVETLQELGANCEFYIPNRFTEGYGPNEMAFQKAANDGISLVITVDTGIAAEHEIDIANQLGMDVIITDHHEIQEKVPDAYAIIHPKSSPDYAFKELAGVGVAFKFAAYLLGYFPKQFLDLVAIGTIADMVPLLEENRILAFFGLRSISTTQRPGLRALKKICQITEPVTEEDIGYSIGPRLNAVGRLQDAALAVHLLMTKDEEQAIDHAKMIEELNKQRKQIVQDIMSEAEDMVAHQGETGVIVVAKEGWNEGVLGIVASRLVKKYDRPAIVLSIKNESNIAKGSARSIPAFDIFHACMRIRDLFSHFGGHSQAAGMSLSVVNLDTLRRQLHAIILEELDPDDFTQIIDVNRKLTLPEINEQLIQEIQQLAPFGMLNPKPIFQIEEVPIERRQIGSQKNHLKLEFKQDTYALSGIGFGMGHLYAHIAQKTPVSVVGELGVNEWNGKRKLQIMMKDLGVHTWQLFDYRGKKELDIQALRDSHTTTLALSKNEEAIESWELNDIPLWTYDMGTDTLDAASSLVILDVPDSLEQLQAIVEKVQPESIHACYTIEQGVYMRPFPTREDFIWLYALVQKRKALDLKKELNHMMRQKKWTKERIIFMARVFQELGFVRIENGVIHMESHPVKKDLQDSSIYQQRIKRAAIEKTLYYSTYDTLRQWFEDCLPTGDKPKEEATAHGL